MSDKCELCRELAPKYKCPRCHVATCSLECVKEHKIRHNCSGIRNKVKMLEKDEMTNLALLSDYRFLEEIDNKLEDGTRNALRKLVVNKEMFADLPPHLKRLKTEARKRGTVLEFMPKHFSKHQQNSTRFNFREGKIRWHIKWVFPHADVSFTDKSVAEDKLIVDILQKYMEPRREFDEDDSDLERENDLLSVEDSAKLEYYQSASYRRISVLLKSELCYYDDRFTELFLSRSLRDNFANRKIVEHPVLYVVFKDHLQAFIGDKPDEGFSDLLREPKRIIESSQQLDDCTRTSEQDSRNPSDGVYKSVNSQRVRKTKEGLSFFDEFSDYSDE